MLKSIRSLAKKNIELDASGVPWGDEIPFKARKRIATYWDFIVENYLKERFDFVPDFWFKVSTILSLHGGWNVPGKFSGDELMRSRDQELTLDALEAFSRALRQEQREDLNSDYKEWVNQVFNEHRIGYKFVDNKIVSFEDDYLMKNIVEPATTILISSKFAEAKSAYQDALDEITKGKPGDALTDAGTALQSILSALGCEGNELGRLIKSAKKKGILGPQDEPLCEAVVKWVASERNQISDAHGVSEANIADAWLMVHVVGALIVRLADETNRPKPKNK